MTTLNTDSPSQLGRPKGDLEAAGLEPLLGRLPEPRNYLDGFTAAVQLRPVRILLFRRQKLEGHQRSMHGRHVLILCLAGGGQVGVGPDIVDLQPGDAVLVLPFRMHYYAHVPESLNWLYITFELAEPCDLDPLAARCTGFDAADQALLAELVGHFLAAVPGTAESNGAAAEAAAADVGEAGLTAALVLLLTRLVARARQRDAAEALAVMADTTEQHAARNATEAAGAPGSLAAGPGGGTPRLDLERAPLEPEVLVMARINSDLSALPSLAGLAADAGISESHLRDRFRERFGMSLGRYMRAARLEEAARLLAHTGLRVKEVAAQVGYESPFAFSRAFADYTGHSPRAWRRQRG